MKNLFKLSLAIISIYLSFIACKKDNSSSNTTIKPSLILSKTNLKKGEPLSVSASGATTNSFIRWKISPSTNVVISTAGVNSVIQFANAGVYTVQARYYLDSMSLPYDSSASTINVSDSTYTPPAINSGMDTLNLSGDQLLMQPIFQDSGLVMLVHTQKTYDCFPTFIGYSYGELIDSMTTNLPTLFCNFQYINSATSSSCNGAKNTASTYMFFPLSIGTHKISFELNGQFYTGSVTVSSNSYSFTWNYTSGIIISPLQVQKQ